MLGLLSLRLIAALTAASAIVGTTQAADRPQRPFPQHVTYAPGTIKPDNHRQSTMDDDVRHFYAWWKSRYLVEAGTIGGAPAYRICIGSEDAARTVSEGQGYGLIIVALMAGHDPDAQQVFDGLLAFTLAHPSENAKALMAWQIPFVEGDGDSAFDGDADIAYALMLADAQWGGHGRFNYRAEARQRLAALRRWATARQTGLPMLGDWVRANDNLIDETMARTSDFMPAHFVSFARYTNDRRWRRSATRSRAAITMMQASLSPATGLVPDFVTRLDQAPEAAPAGFLEGAHDGAFFTNAARVPWRIGTDALLNGDPDSIAQARKISHWIERKTDGRPQAIRAGYQLDGTVLDEGDYFTDLYAGPFGVAAMADPAQQDWLNAVYDAVRHHREDYYEDSIGLLSMLVMTGNYWDPTIGTRPADRPASAARRTPAAANRPAARSAAAGPNRPRGHAAPPSPRG